MSQIGTQDVFIHLAGQDDNLGDSALRVSYLDALRGDGRRFHIYFGAQTADYISGFALDPRDVVYTRRSEWLAASHAAPRHIHVFNAGEINPPAGTFPNPKRAKELQFVADAGGIIIAAGFGLKNPYSLDSVEFAPALREAALVSWRDRASRDAAGFGSVAPDWGYALGSSTADWASADSRPLLAVTLRFDRPWPDDSWFKAVRSLATRTSRRIVTMAQVARDAPRAVRLAEALDAEYLMPPRMDHATLDAYARDIFGRSLAVVSDRAHGLIIGATEGAFPIGTAADPQKIGRLLDIAGLADLVGRYDQAGEFASRFTYRGDELAASIDGARSQITDLRQRIHAAMRTADAS